MNSEWMDQALCKGMVSDTWFLRSSVQAKRICAQCPVVVQCFKYALEVDARDGVWGGVDMDNATAVAARREELS